MRGRTEWSKLALHISALGGRQGNGGSIWQSADFPAGKGAEAEGSVGLYVHCDQGGHDAREPSTK